RAARRRRHRGGVRLDLFEQVGTLAASQLADVEGVLDEIPASLDVHPVDLGVCPADGQVQHERFVGVACLELDGLVAAVGVDPVGGVGVDGELLGDGNLAIFEGFACLQVCHDR